MITTIKLKSNTKQHLPTHPTLNKSLLTHKKYHQINHYLFVIKLFKADELI